MNVGVVGLGKLGLPLAALLANSGNKVFCYDKSSVLIDQLKSGLVNSSEPGLQKMCLDNSTNLTYSSNVDLIVQNADVIFIIVPTPSLPSGHFSNEYLINALTDLGNVIQNENRKIVIDIVSTVMPGSCEEILIPALEKSSGKKIGIDLGFCYNPEFIALGSVISNMEYADMHLVGESSSWAGELVENALKSMVKREVPTMRMNLREAELVKIAVNNFVTMKISYANGLYQAASKLGGIDIDTVTNAIGLDSRIGSKYLKGAAPYGGPCFPRDTRALDALYSDLGLGSSLSTATDNSNKNHIKFIANQVSNSAGVGRKIGIAGISYKTGTPVTEESPGLAIARELAAIGHGIIAWDDEGATSGNENIPIVDANEFLEKSEFILVSRPIFDKNFVNLLRKKSIPFLDLWRQI